MKSKSRKGSKKRIAVLMAAYKNVPGITKTLQSLEPFADLLDVFIIDDGNKPKLRPQPHKHVKVLRLAKNSGVAVARNAGLQAIYRLDYDYIAIIDAGDVVINDRFRKQMAFLDAHPDHGAVSSYANRVTMDGKFLSVMKAPLTADKIKRIMPWVNPVINPATMIRREAAMKIGFYDEAFQVASDYDFYFRLAQVSKIANLDEPLIEYETGHFHSISSSRKFLQHWNTLQIRLRYFDPLHPYAYLGVAKALIQLARFHPASRRLCGGAKAIKA